jgi:small-conductance mechanosensitive channel
LRAPVRIAGSFARALLENEQEPLGEVNRRYAGRIRSAVGDMESLIGALLELVRLGREEVRLRPVQVRSVLDSCLRSLEGEQLVFSNSDLLRSRIRNFKRMKQRRVMFSLRLRPDTPPEKLMVIPDILRDIINTQEKATFDRAHFKEIGLSALLYEVVYFVDSPEYRVYMDIQQCINLEVSRRFAEDGIHLAFPA